MAFLWRLWLPLKAVPPLGEGWVLLAGAGEGTSDPPEGGAPSWSHQRHGGGGKLPFSKEVCLVGPRRGPKLTPGGGGRNPQNPMGGGGGGPLRHPGGWGSPTPTHLAFPYFGWAPTFGTNFSFGAEGVLRCAVHADVWTSPGGDKYTLQRASAKQT